jgi:hypothetical protein
MSLWSASIAEIGTGGNSGIVRKGHTDIGIPRKLLGRCLKCGRAHLFEGGQWSGCGTKITQR